MPFKTTNIGGVLQSQYQQDPRLLMALQGMQQGSSSAPVQSGWEGIARALQGPINAYTAKKLQGEYQGKQADQYSAIADILAPPTTSKSAPVTADLGGLGSLNATPPDLSVDSPNHAKIMAALQSGLLTPDVVAPTVAENLGFGKPKTPIKLGKDDRLFAADNFDKPLVDVAPEQPNPNKPFNPDGSPNPAYQAYEQSLRKSGRPQMSVNVSADRSFGTQLGENAGKILDASHSAAAGGIQTLNTVAQIKSALATGKVTAGPGANAIQFFNQVAGGDPDKVVATRQAIQGLAQLTLAGRSALKGQGQISDYEGKLLAKASSGEIDSMTVKEIAAIADVADRNARISIRLNKQNVDKARRAAPDNQDLVDFYNVDEPPATPKKSGRFTIEQQ